MSLQWTFWMWLVWTISFTILKQTKIQLQPATRQGNAMQYIAHSSAEDHKEFLCNKLADMVEAGHWLVLPYGNKKVL